ncbi:hypothetical protein DFH08DRAFT_877118 [Mycena albidolilacea]|uniref:Uncharacterized protein n=1 Tax=Mycena albidolilacea TaxID=1033008 RepID=A0AAD6ZT14_9AGAR|nr:hypothetical protein DFH08DRAFT_877118 [Mycena albidolilacea]
MWVMMEGERLGEFAYCIFIVVVGASTTFARAQRQGTHGTPPRQPASTRRAPPSGGNQLPCPPKSLSTSACSSAYENGFASRLLHPQTPRPQHHLSRDIHRAPQRGVVHTQRDHVLS